jgi:hypothetical protein
MHKGCMIHIENKSAVIPLNNCWASSRLDRLWRFEWVCKDKSVDIFHRHFNEGHDFAGYPCNTKAQKNVHDGYWISGPNINHNNGKKIYFRADLLKLYRVKKFQIHWIQAPADWQIYTSIDMSLWEPAFQRSDK